MKDAGLRIVASIYNLMQIDEAWMVQHERGFSWWGGALAQHIWADPCFEEQGRLLSRVYARTDLLRDFEGTDKQIEMLGLLARFASLSGFIRNPDNPSHIQMASSIYVHDQNEELYKKLMAWATSIQVAEAHILIQGLGELRRATVATSVHPVSGQRVDMDDMLNVIDLAVAPSGQEPSLWVHPEFEQAVKFLQQPPCVLVTGDTHGLTAEFPFPGSTSLFRAIAQEHHPRLGNGCLLRLTLPLEEKGVTLIRRALALNDRKVRSHTNTPFLGSWCADKRGLTFVSFLPNCLYAPGVITNLVLASSLRALWVTEEVFGYDARAHFQDALRMKADQMARMVEVMRGVPTGEDDAGSKSANTSKRWWQF
jgi:hypothetical protein